MVIFMKISTTNTLGNKLMARNNERRMVKATSERFEMSKKDIINNGVNAKIVKDKMGMLMASQALGDEIASTIRTGMNICAINFAQFIGEDGTLGENAVHVALMYSGLYWKVWDRQTKTVNFEKAEKIVESRAGAKLEPIYNKDDVMLAENKYNIKRYIYGVNDFYLRRAEMALNAINANTTLEELERFQREFVFLTRGLGEQTIDVTKHINYVFYTTMKRLISPYITVVGGIKELESNIKTYRRSKEEYTVGVKPDPNRKVDYKEDVIGIFKQAAVDTMEESMRGFIDLLEKECNYNSYKQYDSIDLTEKKNFLLATVIGEAQDNVMDMDNDTRERCLAGIYNMADGLGINQSDVFKIAMKLAISEVKVRKGEVYIIPAIGSEHEYKIDIWKTAMLFGDVFTAQYTGQDVIEVPVEYETEIDIEEGEIIDIVNGYGYGGMLHIVSPFQDGQVKIKDNEVVALYNPLQTILEKYPSATVLPIESYSKDICKFSTWTKAKVEDLENDTAIGYTDAKNAIGLRIARVPENYGVIAIAKDNSITAAAKVNEAYFNESNDFLVSNAICFKSVIVADIKLDLDEEDK
ncbi:MAG: hypothetical protein MSA15_15950 [Clostridium sp.]|nr:hypothetical protein [Clostridium sp.]